MSSIRATLCGLCAILIWSMLIALMRSVTEVFGATLGAPLVYSAFAVSKTGHSWPQDTFQAVSVHRRVLLRRLWTTVLPIHRACPWQPANAGSRACQLPVALPDCAFFSDHSKAESAFLSLPGPAVFLFGNRLVRFRRGFRPRSFHGTCFLQPHSLSSGLHRRHLLGTLLQRGKTVHTIQQYRAYLLLVIAIVLWLRRFVSGEPFPSVPPQAFLNVLITAICFGSSYTLWEVGIQHGNILFLATVSYFTPIFSTLFTCLWLSVLPVPSFWFGVGMVGLGSVLSWLATQKKWYEEAAMTNNCKCVFTSFNGCLFRDDCMSKSILRSA